MPKRSQAAMEFLMTYGWAILVVLAAVAALAYFGVLNPEKFLPNKCVIEPGLACVDSKIEASKTTLVLSNGLGKTIAITNIAVGTCSAAFTADLLSGTENTFVLDNCNNGIVQDKFKAGINVTYTSKDTGLSQKMYGSITTKVQ